MQLQLLEIEALASEIREARLRLAELVATMRKRQPTIRLRMESLREQIERVAEQIERVAEQQRALTAQCHRLQELLAGKRGSHPH